MKKPRNKANQLWIDRLKQFVRSLESDNYERLELTVKNKPEFDRDIIFDTRILGSQRLILDEIVENIPPDVEQVVIPFACGLDLPYGCARKGLNVICCDRMKTVKAIADYIFKKQPQSFSRAAQIMAWLEHIYVHDLQVPVNELVKKNQKYLERMTSRIKPNQVDFRFGDANMFLQNVLNPDVIQLVYLGMPTVMPEKRYKVFHKRYDVLEALLYNDVFFCQPDDWHEGNELAKFRELVYFCHFTVPYVITGLGTGSRTLGDTVKVLKQYYTYVGYIYKPFVGFDDWVIFGSKKRLNIKKVSKGSIVNYAF